MQEDELFATRVLLDAETSSKPIGLIQIYVYPDAFLSAMEQSIYRENGVLLVDESGNTVAHRAVADAMLDAQIQQACASYEAGFYEQDTYFLQVSETLKNGWRCYYYIDRVEISESLNQIQIATIRVIGICLVLALCLILGLSKVLNHRILQLKEYAERVSQGNLQLEMQTDWTDEIGIVEKSFAHMSNQINRMMNEMYELGLQKRAEELKALQAMINPHFLYNGLSSIKWKAIRAEQDEIAEAAGLLAKFYRTALNSGKQITTVQNELENIRAYLKIQSYMHDFSFDVEYEIDEEGLAWWMPNFILQPIVENAICHGVEYCENERGWIRVEFTQEGEYLMFRIYNNGSTLDVAEFEKPEKSESGYGLSNIRERIWMHFEDGRCGVFGENLPDNRVCVTVCVKRIEES
jgi:two-component system sensor histidine kinase YesM